jgi:hypothetical protein
VFSTSFSVLDFILKEEVEFYHVLKCLAENQVHGDINKDFILLRREKRLGALVSHFSAKARLRAKVSRINLRLYSQTNREKL